MRVQVYTGLIITIATSKHFKIKKTVWKCRMLKNYYFWYMKKTFTIHSDIIVVNL